MGLVQVIRLNAKALEISFGSALCYCLVVALMASNACFRRGSPASAIPSSVRFIWLPLRR